MKMERKTCRNRLINLHTGKTRWFRVEQASSSEWVFFFDSWKEGHPKPDSDAKIGGQYHIVKDMGLPFCMNIFGTHRVLLGHIIDYHHMSFGDYSTDPYWPLMTLTNSFFWPRVAKLSRSYKWQFLDFLGLKSIITISLYCNDHYAMTK